ncbi:hypothetical protein HDV00_011299 [Rhizophlyctis rosea]|nr:hypothetical protein HDV00_011299 [Rhizophlyctis rosea]
MTPAITASPSKGSLNKKPSSARLKKGPSVSKATDFPRDVSFAGDGAQLDSTAQPDATPATPKARSRPLTAVQQTALQIEERRYDGLILSMKDTDALLKLISDGRVEEACTLIRDILHLPPPPPPQSEVFVNPAHPPENVLPDPYDPDREDNAARGTILARMLVDALKQGYIQHIRLITFVFTHPQDVAFTRAVQMVEERPSVQPLAVAIPEENWEEYLKQVEEAERARQEAIRLEEERVRAEEEEKLRKERGEVAEPTAPSPPPPQPHHPTLTLPPFKSFPTPPPPLPTLDTLFPCPTAPTASTPLNPPTISQTLLTATTQHLTTLTAHLQAQLDHQFTEMQARLVKVQGVVEERRKEKEKEKGGKEKEGKPKSREGAKSAKEVGKKGKK